MASAWAWRRPGQGERWGAQGWPKHLTLRPDSRALRARVRESRGGAKIGQRFASKSFGKIRARPRSLSVPGREREGRATEREGESDGIEGGESDVEGGGESDGREGGNSPPSPSKSQGSAAGSGGTHAQRAHAQRELRAAPCSLHGAACTVQALHPPRCHKRSRATALRGVFVRAAEPGRSLRGSSSRSSRP